MNHVQSCFVLNPYKLEAVYIFFVYFRFENDPDVDELRFTKNRYDALYRNLSQLRGLKVVSSLNSLILIVI